MTLKYLFASVSCLGLSACSSFERPEIVHEPERSNSSAGLPFPERGIETVSDFLMVNKCAESRGIESLDKIYGDSTLVIYDVPDGYIVNLRNPTYAVLDPEGQGWTWEDVDEGFFEGFQCFLDAEHREVIISDSPDEAAYFWMRASSDWEEFLEYRLSVKNGSMPEK